MKIALVLIRLALAALIGWPLTFAPVLILAPFGMHAWGWAHTGLPLVLYPLAIWLTYFVLGFVPPFKASDDDGSHEESKVQ